jgi:hypothetical protein
MKHPESWALGQVPWQFFCTLTWANAGSFKRPPSPRREVSAAFAFLREAACVAGVHFKKSMWCLRHETGEMTGRDHYHCLLSVLGSQWVRLSTCFYLMDYWDKKLGCGHARVRIFAPAEPYGRGAGGGQGKRRATWRRGLHVQRPGRKSGREGSLRV